MNAFWSYFWPLAAAGLVIGAIAGSISFRRRSGGDDLKSHDQAKRRWVVLTAGIAASLAVTALWSGPMGAANLFVHRVERDARITLDNYEMLQVAAHLHRSPLSRRLILHGQADDLQRSELAAIMVLIPGVREARWSSDGGGLPLFAESAAVAILGFLFGLLLAYLVELRRRYNAQWNW